VGISFAQYLCMMACLILAIVALGIGEWAAAALLMIAVRLWRDPVRHR